MVIKSFFFLGGGGGTLAPQSENIPYLGARARGPSAICTPEFGCNVQYFVTDLLTPSCSLASMFVFEERLSHSPT